MDSALEDLGDEVLGRASIWQDAVAGDPARQVVEGAEAQRWVREVHDLVDLEAAQLMIAEASGASAAEQRELMGMTRERIRTIRHRVEMAQDALRERAYGALAWVLPEGVLRWLIALGSTGSVPRLGAAGVAITAVLAGGAGVATLKEPAAAPLVVQPALTQASAGSSQPAGAIAVVTRAATSAASEIRTREADRQAKTKADAEQERRAARRARARTAGDGAPSAARQEFTPSAEPAPSAPAPSVRSTAAAPSAGGASAAEQEFVPSGR